MLGLTLGCARCHDHKFDPVPTADYYALAGIFSSTVTLENRIGGPLDDESDWSRRGLGAGADTQLERFLEEHRYTWVKAGRKVYNAKKKLNRLREEDVEERQKLEKELAGAEQALAELESGLPPFAMAVKDVPNPGDASIRIRGVAASHGDTVARGFLQVASWDGQPTVNPQSSGRLELAHWIGSSETPLTARVRVNQIWKHHFDVGLVQS